VRDEYRGWARAVADSTGVPFIDLTEIIARRYEQMGPERVNMLVADPLRQAERARDYLT
jgi:hypothetical protein